MLGGGGKSSCTVSKNLMLVLATVPVHETSLANQHYIVRFWGGRRGYVKRVAMLCKLV